MAIAPRRAPWAKARWVLAARAAAASRRRMVVMVGFRCEVSAAIVPERPSAALIMHKDRILRTLPSTPGPPAGAFHAKRRTQSDHEHPDRRLRSAFTPGGQRRAGFAQRGSDRARAAPE